MSEEINFETSDLERELTKYNIMVYFNEKDANAYYYRSIVNGQLGNYIEQVKDLNKALEIDPTNEEFLKYKNLLEQQDAITKRSSRKIRAAIKENIEKKDTN